jgi:hypothetical protein
MATATGDWHVGRQRKLLHHIGVVWHQLAIPGDASGYRVLADLVKNTVHNLLSGNETLRDILKSAGDTSNLLGQRKLLHHIGVVWHQLAIPGDASGYRVQG